MGISKNHLEKWISQSNFSGCINQGTTLWCFSAAARADGGKSLETLRNRTAVRLRTAEWRRNVALDRECTMSGDTFFVILPSWVFQSFCCVRSLVFLFLGWSIWVVHRRGSPWSGGQYFVHYSSGDTNNTGFHFFFLFFFQFQQHLLSYAFVCHGKWLKFWVLIGPWYLRLDSRVVWTESVFLVLNHEQKMTSPFHLEFLPAFWIFRLRWRTQLTERISDCIAGDQSRTHQFTTTEEKPFLLQLRVQVDRLLRWKSYNLDLISFIAYKLYSHIIASISNNNCTWFWVVLSAGSFCGRSIF